MAEYRVHFKSKRKAETIKAKNLKEAVLKMRKWSDAKKKDAAYIFRQESNDRGYEKHFF